MKRVHEDGCPYPYGHDCECNMNKFYHDNSCPWRYGHDCECGLIEYERNNK